MKLLIGMSAKFEFYNVGQGTFYGGVIKNNHQEFVVVYDCGSVTVGAPLTQPIENFRKRFNKIDLLIVSHFDNDHVNGIRDLITGPGMSVERIVLPYMSIIQRLALLTSQDNNDDYTQFISNPTEYLLNDDTFNVGSISYIDKAEYIEEEESHPYDDSEEVNELKELSLKKPENDPVVKEKILQDDPNLDDPKVSYLPYNSRFTIGTAFWEFVFYHKKTKKDTDITSFQAAVKRYQKSQNISTDELFTVARRIKIKKLYKQFIAKDINHSSLCLFHGPLFNASIISIVSYKDERNKPHLIDRCFNTRHIRGAGTILTGDQFLKKDADFNPFYNYFKNRLNKTKVYQVPHHGSFYSWKEMPNELNKYNICYYLINHGYQRVKHPDHRILHNIMTYSNSNVILNNENTSFTYRIIAGSV